MPRYKITYSKTSWLGPGWECKVYDRIKDDSFSGVGRTKKEAKDQAFDYIYEQKRTSSSDYSSSSNTHYLYDSSPHSPSIGEDILYIVSVIIGVAILACVYVLLISLIGECGHQLKNIQP